MQFKAGWHGFILYFVLQFGCSMSLAFADPHISKGADSPLPTAQAGSSAGEFDALIQQYENGQLVLYHREDAAKYIASLVRLLPPNDPKRARRLSRERCSLDYLDNPRQGITFATKLINTIENADAVNLTYFYLCRAQYYATVADVAAQLKDLQQAQALAESSEDAQAQADTFSTLADYYSTRGEHADALARLFRAYELYQKTNNEFALGYSLENIATAFRRMGEYDKALEYLDLSERDYMKPDDTYRAAFIAQQRYFIFAELDQPQQARKHAERALALYQHAKDLPVSIGVKVDLVWINNLGRHFRQSAQLIEEIERDIKVVKQNQPDFLPYNVALYQLYQAQTRAGLGDIKGALTQFDMAASAIEQENNPRYMVMLLKSWSQTLAKAGQFAKAYELQHKLLQLQDDLGAQSKKQREALLRYQFDSQQQQTRNMQLQQQNKAAGAQLAVLEQAQRWQYIALGLFVLVAVMAVFFAISQIKRNVHLQKLAMTDELTKIGNRRSILAYCQQICQQSRQNEQYWCLLLLDLDHFKLCNDRFGHEAGDIVLIEAAKAMQSVLRAQDRLGRSGGEEFIIVLSNTREQQARDIAERIRAKVEQLVFADYPTLQITLSIGITQAGRQEEVREIIARADQALYQAKALGRNQLVVA